MYAVLGVSSQNNYLEIKIAIKGYSPKKISLKRMTGIAFIKQYYRVVNIIRLYLFPLDEELCIT